MIQRRKSLIIVVVLLAMLLVSVASVAAQTATPIPPTSTIAPLTINTNGLLTQINTWTASLDDIIFLGVAIAIAIAILTFIGNQILKAFKGTG